ncbi:MAG: hypothetical protein BM564_07215 [Bacteroidetes bacterium MedPE-SWsnd-G2]|nr:MAG: hypothetical protein BM564_07215 [Bacteroidetes bacterium MedPE-SWsnd-G2]
MKIKYLSLLCLILLLSSCKNETQLYKIEGQQIPVSDSIPINEEIDAFIKPYRTHINKDLDSTLAYCVKTYSKNDGHLNTAIGNFMADVVFEQGDPVFYSRTGKHMDMVLLNHGGIRSILSKGKVTARNAYELMPFDNSIVVVELRGEQVIELTNYLATRKKAHPISKLNLKVDKDFNIQSALINGEPITKEKTYYVATNDYLYNGGSHMDFFQTNVGMHKLDYKIRNSLIDYFSKVDTINPVIDDRFIQIN